MCFQAVKGVTIAHTALCPLTASRMSISWLPAGITVTYIPSNDNRAPATVIYASQCGQSVASSNQGTEDRPFPHGFSQHVTRRAHRASNPPPPWSLRFPLLPGFCFPLCLSVFQMKAFLAAGSSRHNNISFYKSREVISSTRTVGRPRPLTGVCPPSYTSFQKKHRGLSEPQPFGSRCGCGCRRSHLVSFLHSASWSSHFLLWNGRLAQRPFPGQTTSFSVGAELWFQWQAAFATHHHWLVLIVYEMQPTDSSHAMVHPEARGPTHTPYAASHAWAIHTIASTHALHIGHLTHTCTPVTRRCILSLGHIVAS